MAITSAQESAILFKKFIAAKAITKTDLAYYEEFFNSRPATLPSQIWAQAEQIPYVGNLNANFTNPLLASPDGAIYNTLNGFPLIEKVNSVQLKNIPGTLAFMDADAVNGIDQINYRIKDIIPFNLDPTDLSYDYVLRTASGQRIAPGREDWYFDPDAGILIFLSGNLPSGVTTANGPRITCYKYIGLRGTVASGSGGGNNGAKTTVDIASGLRPIVTGGNMELATNGKLSQQSFGDIRITVNGKNETVAQTLGERNNRGFYFSTFVNGTDVVPTPGPSHFLIVNSSVLEYDLQENDEILMIYDSTIQDLTIQIDLSGYYTAQEVDLLISASTAPDLTDFYTKAEIDTFFSNYYSIPEIDAIIGNIYS